MMVSTFYERVLGLGGCSDISDENAHKICVSQPSMYFHLAIVRGCSVSSKILAYNVEHHVAVEAEEG